MDQTLPDGGRRPAAWLPEQMVSSVGSLRKVAQDLSGSGPSVD